jgi:ABC-2 type transport system ATP-binding protein
MSPMQAAPMIEVEGVVYDYPTARALHGVSFTVEAGTVLALVGPNGAGKSTLMRCIAALDTPTEGTIRVAGLDVGADPRGVHRAIGYLPDFFGLYDELTVRRALIYAARSRGVAAARAGEAAEAAAARVRLLDEPAAGLDPEARRGLSDLILALAKGGMTIMVSSHILAELEDYSSQMLMIRDGRTAGGGVVEAGGASLAAAKVEVTFADPPSDLAERLDRIGAVVAGLRGDSAVLTLAAGEDEAVLLGRLIAAGLKVKSFQPARTTLEDAYLAEVRR